MSSTAVIVVDFQNEYVRDEGKLHDRVAEVMKETRMVQKVPHVIREARKAGALIIHSSIIMQHGERFGDLYKEDDPFFKDAWNCKFAEEALPQEGDVICIGRKNSSVFGGTQVEEELRKKNIKRIFVMGFLTNLSVVDTIMEADTFFPEAEVIMCIDGCAAFTKEEHYNSMKALTLMSTSIFVSCSEAQDMLKEGVTSPPTGFPVQRTSQSRPGMNLTYRPRILALHGAKSNNDVTRLQLENLDITEENYDILYVHGIVQVEHGD